MKIISEDQAVETRTSELLFDWEKGKPVQGSVRPDVALNNLAIYEGKFSRLKEDRDNVARAKEALELMEPGLFLVIIPFSCIFLFILFFCAFRGFHLELLTCSHVLIEGVCGLRP